MRGADLLVRTLKNAGVKTIFTLSGNQIMPIFDACVGADIRLVHVRHEASAVYMADAWAQITGEIGVALVPAGTGFLNAVGPLYPAKCAESPILLISGDSCVSQDGLGAFQELDQVKVSSPMTKTSLKPESANDIGRMAADAIKTACSGRNGPVHLALAHDLLDTAIENPEVPESFSAAPQLLPDGDLNRVVSLLAHSKKPLMLCGPQLNRSRQPELHALASESIKAPLIAMESPRGLSDPSLGAFSEVINEADLVVFLGKEVDFTSRFANDGLFTKECRIVIIDPEIEAIEQAQRVLGERLEFASQADAKRALEQIIEISSISQISEEWLSRVQHARSFRGGLDFGQGLSPHNVCQSVQKFLDGVVEPILIADGGEFCQWGHAFIHTDTRIINGVSGAIGGGLCFAIAAKIARPDATVVALMGDGTAGFHFSEFDTAARNDANFIALIGNDSQWNAEVLIQKRDYGSDRAIGCQLGAQTRYDIAASGLGAHGEWVTEIEQLELALTRSSNSQRPACVNVKLESSPAPTFSLSGY